MARIVGYNILFLLRKAPLLLRIAGARGRQRHVLAELRTRRAADGAAPADICFAAPGAGIGDNIVLARFARDLARHCGPLAIDFASYNPDRDRWIFGGVDGFRELRSAFLFDAIAPEYALAIEISQVACVRHADPGHAALAPRTPLAKVVSNLQEFQKRNALDIGNLPFSSGALARRAVYANYTRATFLHGQAGIAYGGDPFALAKDASALVRHKLDGRRYVTVHNGFDPDFIITRATATKCYPHFASVVSELKLRYPHLLLVQIGGVTSVPIAGMDINLVGKTTMREVAAIIAGAECHLDNESGLVQVAACLGTRSCVVFGPTDADYFGYPQNVNVRPGFCGGCWWTTDSWMDQCPRGFATATCMHSIAPEDVVRQLLAALSGSLAGLRAHSLRKETDPEARSPVARLAGNASP